MRPVVRGPQIDGPDPLLGLLGRPEPLPGLAGGGHPPGELFGVVAGGLPVHSDLGSRRLRAEGQSGGEPAMLLRGLAGHGPTAHGFSEEGMGEPDLALGGRDQPPRAKPPQDWGECVGREVRRATQDVVAEPAVGEAESPGRCPLGFLEHAQPTVEQVGEERRHVRAVGLGCELLSEQRVTGRARVDSRHQCGARLAAGHQPELIGRLDLRERTELERGGAVETPNPGEPLRVCSGMPVSSRRQVPSSRGGEGRVASCSTRSRVAESAQWRSSRTTAVAVCSENLVSTAVIAAEEVQHRRGTGARLHEPVAGQFGQEPAEGERRRRADSRPAPP